MITLGAKEIIQGESQSEYISDRGFSPNSYGLNLTKTRGMLYFAESGTERGGSGTTLTGNIIASADDQNYLGNDKYFLDDEGAFYTLSGSTLTKRQTATGTFVLGTSDMIQFNLSTYATSQAVLHQLTGGDLATCERLWVGAGNDALDANFRHPMEVVEDELFVASKNIIYYVTSAGSTGTAFTLPVQTNITTLRKHPNGRTLLAFTGTTGDSNGAHTRSGLGKVYYCNPSIRDWEREVVVESQVEGSRLVGGVVYVTWGNNFGYFNGDGLVPLKRLETSTTTYSQCISNMEDILIFRDGRNVIAYGDLGAGRVFWKPFRNTISSQNINHVCYKGDNKLLVAFSNGSSAGLLYEIDYDNSGSSGYFESNKYTMPTLSKIEQFEILHDMTAPAGSTRFQINERDTEGNKNLIHLADYTNESTTKTRRNCHVETDLFQFTIDPLNDDLGYKLFRFHHAPLK